MVLYTETSLLDQSEEKEDSQTPDHASDMRAALNALCIEKCSKISSNFGVRKRIINCQTNEMTV